MMRETSTMANVAARITNRVWQPIIRRKKVEEAAGEVVAKETGSLSRVAGSYEERTSAIEKALRENQLYGKYPRVLSTFAKKVFVEGDDGRYFEVEYWMEGSEARLGMAKEIERQVKYVTKEDIDDIRRRLFEATWSSKKKSDLPDSSFAYIEPGGKKDEEGKTVPRSLRHFPLKKADGSWDAAHVTNAYVRLSSTTLPASAVAIIKSKIRSGYKALKMKWPEDRKETIDPGFLGLVSTLVRELTEGGAGSGNWGHKGRPGLRGGSAARGSGGGAVSAAKGGSKQTTPAAMAAYLKGKQAQGKYKDWNAAQGKLEKKFPGQGAENIQRAMRQVFTKAPYGGYQFPGQGKESTGGGGKTAGKTVDQWAKDRAKVTGQNIAMGARLKAQGGSISTKFDKDGNWQILRDGKVVRAGKEGDARTANAKMDAVMRGAYPMSPATRKIAREAVAGATKPAPAKAAPAGAAPANVTAMSAKLLAKGFRNPDTAKAYLERKYPSANPADRKAAIDKAMGTGAKGAAQYVGANGQTNAAYKALAPDAKAKVLTTATGAYRPEYVRKADQGKLNDAQKEINKRLGAAEAVRANALKKAETLGTGTTAGRAAMHMALSMQQKAQQLYQQMIAAAKRQSPTQSARRIMTAAELAVKKANQPPGR